MNLDRYFEYCWNVLRSSLYSSMSRRGCVVYPSTAFLAVTKFSSCRLKLERAIGVLY